jgi:Spy/CpxP family protein refolding chaperone
MKTTKWLILTTAAALTAGGLITLHARPANKAGQQRIAQGRFLERAKEKLDLTDEQVAQIKAVLKSERETITGLLSLMHDARTGLREAIQAPEATETSVRVAAAKVADVQAELAVERLKLRGKITPILTDAQREKAAQMRARLDKFADRAIQRMNERLAVQADEK